MKKISITKDQELSNMYELSMGEYVHIRLNQQEIDDLRWQLNKLRAADNYVEYKQQPKSILDALEEINGVLHEIKWKIRDDYSIPFNSSNSTTQMIFDNIGDDTLE